MNHTVIIAVALLLGIAAALHAGEFADAKVVDRYPAFDKSVLALCEPWHPPYGFVSNLPTTADGLRDLELARGMSRAVFVSSLESIAEDLMADTICRTNLQGRAILLIRREGTIQRLLNAMGRLGYLEFLPWLDTQSANSKWELVRTESALAYIRIAGLDATPFVERILSGDDDLYGFNCKYLVAREFFAQIEQAEARNAPQEKIDAAYMTLIKQVQTMNGYSTTWSVDKMLANQLPDYATSVQRESVLSRFLNVTNEIAKANFIRKHEEIVNLPEDRKTDLRTRFPGLVVPDDGQGVKDEPSMQEEAAR